jgi:two-component system CheB/CheR fusion protein
MSGYEVAARIKEGQLKPTPLLIALTGYGQAADRRRTADAGFAHHFTKPMDMEKLERLLDAVAA